MSEQNKILILSDNPGADYLKRILTGATKVCGTEGFRAELVNLYGQSKTADEALKEADHSGIVLTPPMSDDRAVLSALEASGRPFVRIAPLLDLERGDTVAMDEFEAASDITKLLVAKGHQRIAIIRGPRTQLVSMRRYNGYANAIGAAGQRVDQSLVGQGDFTRESGKEEALKLFAEKPTAIFASNDDMAAGVIDAAGQAGLRVPDDLSVVGYDDNAVASATRPGLTTVRQPCEAMGETAATALIKRIRAPRASFTRQYVPYEIVERGSVSERSDS